MSLLTFNLTHITAFSNWNNIPIRMLDFDFKHGNNNINHIYISIFAWFGYLLFSQNLYAWKYPVFELNKNRRYI